MSHLNFLKTMVIRCLNQLPDKLGLLFLKEQFFVIFNACLIHRKRLDQSHRKKLSSRLKKTMRRLNKDSENI
jgi:hypothetical protein